MGKLPEGIANLNAKIPRELHGKVKEITWKRRLSIDRFVEGLLNDYFRTQASEVEYTGPVNQQFPPEVALPEPFVRNCTEIYLASADEWAALSRVVAAVARGQESLKSGSDSDRSRLGPIIKPLPVEQAEEDTDSSKAG